MMVDSAGEQTYACNEDRDAEKGYGAIDHHNARTDRRQSNLPRVNRKALGENWMSNLHNDLPVSALSIPGTHDSAAFTSAWPFIETQKMDILQQLNAGIRYYDLRCGIRDDIVEMCHGITYLGLRLNAVLEAMYTWLGAHPTEALIVQIKRDKKEERSTVHFSQAITRTIAAKSECWRTVNTTPTVGELRGKVQLLRRFEGPSLCDYGIDVTRWQDNPSQPFTIWTWHGLQITIQDHYSFPDPEPLPSLIREKGGDVADLLDRASADTDPEHWYVNFTSGFEFNLYYQISPREVAVGGWWAFRWEDGMNIRLQRYLKTHQGKKRYGIVAMDFPEAGVDDLTGAIIRSNFTTDTAWWETASFCTPLLSSLVVLLLALWMPMRNVLALVLDAHSTWEVAGP